MPLKTVPSHSLLAENTLSTHITKSTFPTSKRCFNLALEPMASCNKGSTLSRAGSNPLNPAVTREASQDHKGLCGSLHFVHTRLFVCKHLSRIWAFHAFNKWALHRYLVNKLEQKPISTTEAFVRSLAYSRRGENFVCWGSLFQGLHLDKAVHSALQTQ